MKKAIKFNSRVVIATLCAAAAGSLAAQGPDAPVAGDDSSITANRTYQPPEQKATTSEADQPMKINKCSHLIGTVVENPQGDKLGKIEDVVVDFDNGRVSYCVLRVEHSRFATHKYLAVPLAAFRPNANGSGLILNADKDKVAQAEGFYGNNWPSVTSPAWGAMPFWQETPKVANPVQPDQSINKPSGTSH